MRLSNKYNTLQLLRLKTSTTGDKLLCSHEPFFFFFNITSLLDAHTVISSTATQRSVVHRRVIVTVVVPQKGRLLLSNPAWPVWHNLNPPWGRQWNETSLLSICVPASDRSMSTLNWSWNLSPSAQRGREERGEGGVSGDFTVCLTMCTTCICFGCC